MEDNVPNRDIKHILSLKAHKGNLGSGRVNVIAIFPDKKHFVSGGSDNLIKLWDIDNLREVRRWIQESEDYVGEVTTLVIVDNNQFLSGGYDEEVKLWDKRRNEPLKRFFTGTNIDEIALSLDKKFFISRDMLMKGGMQYTQSQIDKSGGKIQLWDLESSTKIATLKEKGYSCVIFFPSNPLRSSSPDVLGEIVLGKVDGEIEYWQIKKTDTSVEFQKIRGTNSLGERIIGTPSRLYTFRVGSIIHIPSSNNYSGIGKFIAKVVDVGGSKVHIVKFEISSRIDINFKNYWYTTKTWNTYQCNGLGLAICSDNRHILLQDGGSLYVLDSHSDLISYKPQKINLFNVDPNVDKVSSIPKLSCLSTIAILNNDMIFTGWNDGKIKIWSSRNYPIGRSNSNWFNIKMSPDQTIHMKGFLGDPGGDKLLPGGMKKSKRVYKRSNRIVNKTRGRKK